MTRRVRTRPGLMLFGATAAAHAVEQGPSFDCNGAEPKL